MIRLETSKRTGIDNTHDRQASYIDRNIDGDTENVYQNLRRRTGLSAAYNCHGLTFASRRTHILRWSELQKIIDDDEYKEVDMQDVLPGDIVVYLRDGDANHSGIVVEYERGKTVFPMICSKWGLGGEFIHHLRNCPQAYGPDFKFFRCRL